MNRWSGGLLLLALLGYEAPLAAQDKEPACTQEQAGDAFAGVRYGMTERAHDGQFPVCPDRKTVVDANSDLVISFDVPVIVTAGGTPGTLEQQQLLAVLEKMEALAADIARLEPSKIDPSDSSSWLPFQRTLTELSQRATDMVRELRALGFSSDEITAIVLQPGDGYVNLARAVRDRIAATQERLAQFLASREKFVVQVVAYRDPARSSRIQLHVQDYDDLPLGELRPIDRYGLRLTPAEQERQQAEFAGNRAIASAIGGIMEDADSIRREVESSLQKLASAAEKTVGTLSTSLDNWKQTLDKAQGRLDQVRRDHPTGEVATTLRSLEEQIDGFRKDLTRTGESVQRVKGVVNLLRAPRQGLDLATLMTGTGGIVASLTTVVEDFKAFQSASATWESRAREILKLVDRLPAGVASDLRTAVTLPTLAQVVAVLKSELPLTMSHVERLAPFFNLAVQTDQAANVMADVAKTRFRGLDDLPDAVIELERSGLTLGDRVTVTVRFLELTGPAGTPEPGREVHRTSYRSTVELTGGHGEMSSSVIFARAIDGNEDQMRWKPNVAGMISWHHRFRSPGNIGRVWNSFDPALGLHLANLDQTDDSVEFGIGAQITFWKGLLTGGMGYNLSRRRDGTYAFIGLNLFDLLSSKLR